MLDNEFACSWKIVEVWSLIIQEAVSMIIASNHSQVIKGSSRFDTAGSIAIWFGQYFKRITNDLGIS